MHNDPQDDPLDAISDATPDATPTAVDQASHDDPAGPAEPSVAPFRLAFAPGVTPAKWVGVWRERLADVPLQLVPVDVMDRGAALRAGDVEAGLLRLPIDQEGMGVIPLYTEIPVVVVPVEHAIAAFDEVSVLDLADEVFLHPLDDLLEWDTTPGRPAAERPATTAAAIELVAAGIGVVVVPQSVARAHHRKDLTYRPVTGAPSSRIGFAWVEENMTELVEEFIGIVRGRTANSSRGRSAAAEPAAESGKKGSAPKVRTKAEEKAALARQAADRKAAGARKAAARGGKLTGKRLGKRGNR
ncbi:LysR substrate binding domain-containing protein [Sanguibacter gelidistatuariae]|uniref:LysR substrate binding domain-containing protein n=1 Tax=Sanguibacter gelidistatuariae TaxID=1814289 RepID=A0A1G6QJA1_9MICO|nr:LysR substrate-binding domain-containing protein [Sanguibacter gelidistatuariae]SDC91796.1 LysR substrate binding domain-containing protein [Sanguibacter gelidistatuariae]